jgi:hypothetical protein
LLKFEKVRSGYLPKESQASFYGADDLIVLASFPIKGFLGTGATFEADLNLVVQVIMGVVLIVGSRLAKLKHYAAHGICQATVLLLNLGMIIGDVAIVPTASETSASQGVA